MSLAMKARQKVKRKGPAKDRVFGCDLVEHLQSSGRDIPHVLKSCTEFVEQHGIIDGIYRLSGGSSNTQKLRMEFDNDRNPEINKEVYLKDIHCVSSLCKAYFRELPNPLLTYQLYDKFAEAVAIQLEESRLEKIKEVLKELPSPHHRTLEFLMKHLVHMASFSSQTNMHARNLAIVWAPNLLRSKDIEASGFNGTAAFMEVRIQSIVVEFILTHVEQIFGNAPLCSGTREAIRRSLLALSPVVLSEYCTPYNVPSMLNQGDGPPQMRPYHTIIDLDESKRKGSIKAKKWRSFFNLGRSSHDSKRKLNKAEDKDYKLGKMRLRPAKSMDSLSCMASVNDNDARLGTEIPPKHECFDGPVSLDSSFSESAYMSAKSKCEDTQEEATKSEPTTPKLSRSGLIGGTSQGRSPKSSSNRAEKCAGVHISGPFSVTVPFHITSNLTLSRLTRGLECPALSYYGLETAEAGEDFPGVAEDKEKLMYVLPANKEADEENMLKREPSYSPKHQKARQSMETNRGEKQTRTKEEFPGREKGRNAEAEMDAEESQMSLEVEDSFSFLDSPDGWIDNVLEEEQLQTDSGEGPELPPRSLDTFPSMEDDLGSGFMNEMIAAGMELEMYSTVPHLDYLSIEECMNEHSEGEDDQYYLAMGYIEEETSKEVDAEEVYLSAFDDLSPIASKLGHIQQSDVGQTPHIPPPSLTVEDQTSEMSTETLGEEPKSSRIPEPGLEPQAGDEEVTTRSTGDLVVTKDPDPKLAKLCEMELGSRRNTIEMERCHLADKAEVEPIFSMLQIEDTNVGSEVGLFVPKTECPEEVADPKSLDSESEGGNAEESKVEPIISPLQIEDRNGVDPLVPKTGCPENVASQTPWDPESENQPIKSSTVEKWRPQSPSESEQAPHLPCNMIVEVPPEVVGRWKKPLGDTLVVEEMGEMPHGDAASSVEDLNLLQSPIPSLLDNNSENVSFPAPNPEHTSPPYSPAPLSDSCMDSEDFSLTASSPKPCLENLLQKLQPGFPLEASYAPKHELLDGSVHMKLTSTTPRVQQVKSFPVVPPKPQFARVPPSLKPVIPSKEHLTTVPGKTCENGNKQEHNPSSLKRPFHLTSSDHTSNSHQKTERCPTSPSPSSSSENCCSLPETLLKQRNSMPVNLERFGRDCKDVEDSSPKPPPSSRDKCFSWSKSGDVGDVGLHLMQGSLEKRSSGQHEEGKGAERPTKEGLEGTALQKQRWNNWRYSGSMSFDEAVALAKERHVAQVPMRRMQTVDSSHGASKMEKTAPALKPVLWSPQRPLTCMSPAGSPEAHLLGKVASPPGLPGSIPEGVRPPRLEGFSQDFPLRSRGSLYKIGRRLSVSDEACFGLSHEKR